MAKAEYLSERVSTKDTPYLALMAELWDAFCVDLEGDRPLYNGTMLFMGSNIA